jgi:hypothetical protein
MKLLTSILVICFIVIPLFLFILIVTIDKYINRNTNFGKWWDKNICHELDPNETNF